MAGEERSFPLLDSLSSVFTTREIERKKQLEVIKAKEECNKVHVQYLKDNVISKQDYDRAGSVVKEWSKINGNVSNETLRMLKNKRTTDLIPLTNETIKRRRLGNSPSHQRYQAIEQTSNHNSDFLESSEVCEIVNCGIVFDSRLEFEKHNAGFKHSPCNPYKHLPNGKLINFPLLYTCPKCTAQFQKKIDCQEHMIFKDHLPVLSPVAVYGYMCPQCCMIFHSIVKCHTHMSQTNHYNVTYSFSQDTIEDSTGTKSILISDYLASHFYTKCLTKDYAVKCVTCKTEINDVISKHQHTLSTGHQEYSTNSTSITDEVFGEFLSDKSCDNCGKIIWNGDIEKGFHACTSNEIGFLKDNDCATFREFVHRCGIKEAISENDFDASVQNVNHDQKLGASSTNSLSSVIAVNSSLGAVGGVDPVSESEASVILLDTPDIGNAGKFLYGSDTSLDTPPAGIRDFSKLRNESVMLVDQPSFGDNVDDDLDYLSIGDSSDYDSEDSDIVFTGSEDQNSFYSDVSSYILLLITHEFLSSLPNFNFLCNFFSRNGIKQSFSCMFESHIIQKFRQMYYLDRNKYYSVDLCNSNNNAGNESDASSVQLPVHCDCSLLFLTDSKTSIADRYVKIKTESLEITTNFKKTNQEGPSTQKSKQSDLSHSFAMDLGENSYSSSLDSFLSCSSLLDSCHNIQKSLGAMSSTRKRKREYSVGIEDLEECKPSVSNWVYNSKPDKVETTSRTVTRSSMSPSKKVIQISKQLTESSTFSLSKPANSNDTASATEAQALQSPNDTNVFNNAHEQEVKKLSKKARYRLKKKLEKEKLLLLESENVSDSKPSSSKVSHSPVLKQSKDRARSRSRSRSKSPHKSSGNDSQENSRKHLPKKKSFRNTRGPETNLRNNPRCSFESSDGDISTENLSKMHLLIFLDLDNWTGFFKRLPQSLPNKTFVWTFYGGNTSWKEPKALPFLKLKKDGCFYLHSQCGKTKDAADFAICFTIGKMDDRLPKHVPFAILSGDRGFCEIENQMKNSSRRTVVIDPHEAVKSSEHTLYTMILSVMHS